MIYIFYLDSVQSNKDFEDEKFHFLVTRRMIRFPKLEQLTIKWEHIPTQAQASGFFGEQDHVAWIHWNLR